MTELTEIYRMDIPVDFSDARSIARATDDILHLHLPHEQAKLRGIAVTCGWPEAGLVLAPCAFGDDGPRGTAVMADGIELGRVVGGVSPEGMSLITSVSEVLASAWLAHCGAACSQN